MVAPDTSARELLLHAALRVYARSGIRGATTRRIAQEAGVNEVTLFRHFGSKDALVREALAWRAEEVLQAQLPPEPDDPERELLAFCTEHHRGLSEARSLIRTCMSEFEEHPEAIQHATRTPMRIADDLEAYLLRMRERGLASGDWDPRTAAQLLMGTLFADVMGRDCMPARFPANEQDTLREYVALFLRAIGAARGRTLVNRGAGHAPAGDDQRID